MARTSIENCRDSTRSIQRRAMTFPHDMPFNNFGENTPHKSVELLPKNYRPIFRCANLNIFHDVTSSQLYSVLIAVQRCTALRCVQHNAPYNQNVKLKAHSSIDKRLVEFNAFCMEPDCFVSPEYDYRLVTAECACTSLADLYFLKRCSMFVLFV